MWILFGIVFLFFALRFHLKREARKNPYIEKHRKYLKNESNYENYLRWCEMNTEIPMDKEVFIKEIESRNKKIENLWK